VGAVVYQIRVEYLRRQDGRSYPGLVVQLENPNDPENAVDLRAELDSGAEFSLFDGSLARAIGLDLPNGTPFRFVTTNSSYIDARILPVVISEPDLGRFPIDLRFSISQIQRNILGRDFFNLTQIGFREHHLEVFLTPTS
jgi:hypothetical protein